MKRMRNLSYCIFCAFPAILTGCGGGGGGGNRPTHATYTPAHLPTGMISSHVPYQTGTASLNGPGGGASGGGPSNPATYNPAQITTGTSPSHAPPLAGATTYPLGVAMRTMLKAGHQQTMSLTATARAGDRTKQVDGTADVDFKPLESTGTGPLALDLSAQQFRTRTPLPGTTGAETTIAYNDFYDSGFALITVLTPSEICHSTQAHPYPEYAEAGQKGVLALQECYNLSDTAKTTPTGSMKITYETHADSAGNLVLVEQRTQVRTHTSESQRLTYHYTITPNGHVSLTELEISNKAPGPKSLDLLLKPVSAHSAH